MPPKHLLLLLSLVMILIYLSACSQLEIGVEPTLSFENTPAVSKPTELIATPTPANLTSTPAIAGVEMFKFTHSIYGFSLSYPSTWILQQTRNSIKLTTESAYLLLSFKNLDEDQSIGTGQISGALQENGTINFLTQSITRNILQESGNIVSIYYNSGNEIKAGTMAFSILLTKTDPINPGKLPVETIQEAEKIIESVEASFDLGTTACLNKATFDTDITIPDDTRFSPGEKFTKTWRLINSGTCTWTSSYSLVFLRGDQMSGLSPTPLPTEVLPGNSIELSIELTAPASSGIYRGNWLIGDDKGTQFGIGTYSDMPFWVQITVGEVTPDFKDSLGPATFKDNLNSTDYWFLLDTVNTKFTPGDGKMVLTALTTGKMDEWGLSQYSKLKNFYLEFTFSTGDQCSSLDRYGMIVRAPDPSQGYIFGFSCDGRYRFYKWDGTSYQPIQEWKNSPLIKRGPNQENRMGFYGYGSTLKLFANGQLLAEFDDDTYTEGQFGVFIGAQDNPNFTVSLENVEYWKIDN